MDAWTDEQTPGSEQRATEVVGRPSLPTCAPHLRHRLRGRSEDALRALSAEVVACCCPPDAVFRKGLR
jgi:hypothetical protein